MARNPKAVMVRSPEEAAREPRPGFTLLWNTVTEIRRDALPTVGKPSRLGPGIAQTPSLKCVLKAALECSNGKERFFVARYDASRAN